MLSIDKLIKFKVDACIVHVPSANDVVVNAHSHFNYELALWLAPELKISSFQPSWYAGGIEKMIHLSTTYPRGLDTWSSKCWTHY